MFCNQCEQAANGTGCANGVGVCGKDPDVQSLQETLLYGLKGMAAYAHHARRLGKTDERVSAFIEEALFATMTNVNFDVAALLGNGAGVRPAEPAGDGAAGPGPRGTVRQPAPVTVRRGHPGRPGHPDHRPRPAGPGEPAGGSAKGPTSRSTPTARCCPPTCIPSSASIPTWPATTAGPGRSSAASSRTSAGRSWPPPTACSSRVPATADRLFTTRATAVPGGTRIAGDDFAPVVADGQAAARRCRRRSASSRRSASTTT